MWLKQTLEKHFLQNLQKSYSRADKRVALRDGAKLYPSYTNQNRFHLVGYVQKAYQENGSIFLEIKTNSNENMTITAPEYIEPSVIEFASVLCESVIEHSNGILNNTIFKRTCKKVVIL